MWEAYPPQDLSDFTSNKSLTVNAACVLRGNTFCTRCFSGTLNVVFFFFKKCGACFATACDSRPFDIHDEDRCPLCAPMASAPSLVCGMQVYSTVTLLGPGQGAKAWPTGKFWGFGTLCDAKKRVRVVSSEPLWVFPSSVELLDADVANIGYFLNFRCASSELSAHNS